MIDFTRYLNNIPVPVTAPTHNRNTVGGYLKFTKFFFYFSGNKITNNEVQHLSHLKSNNYCLDEIENDQSRYK